MWQLSERRKRTVWLECQLGCWARNFTPLCFAFPSREMGIKICFPFLLKSSVRKRGERVTSQWRHRQAWPRPGAQGQHQERYVTSTRAPVIRCDEKGTLPLWSSCQNIQSQLNHWQNIRQIPAERGFMEYLTRTHKTLKVIKKQGKSEQLSQSRGARGDVTSKCHNLLDGILRQKKDIR